MLSEEDAMNRSIPASLTLASLVAVAALSVAGSSHADILVFDAVMTGAGVSPPTPSMGTGFAAVTIDSVANTMEVNVTFSDLLSPDTASHIHCCTSVAGAGTAGVATDVPAFPGFPLGVTSGTYDHLFDLTLASSYNPAFVTAEGGVANAESALLAGMTAGKAYFNVHTNLFPGGEISGFLHAVPEPATWVTMLLGFGLAGASLRRRRTSVAA
jgi:hypothetical protein